MQWVAPCCTPKFFTRRCNTSIDTPTEKNRARALHSVFQLITFMTESRLRKMDHAIQPPGPSTGTSKVPEALSVMGSHFVKSVPWDVRGSFLVSASLFRPQSLSDLQPLITDYCPADRAFRASVVDCEFPSFSALLKRLSLRPSATSC